MHKHIITLFILCINSSLLFGQKNAVDIAWNPNSYLKKKHTIQYCVDNNSYKIKHLKVESEADYELFLKHAKYLKHIDSLSICSIGSICKLINELETEDLKIMGDLPDLPNLTFLSINKPALTHLATNLNDFKKLKYLDIGASFKAIPEAIWELKQLEKLHLYGYFTSVSEKVLSLENLNSLSLQGEYKTLPLPTAPKTKLTSLKLSGFFSTTPEFLDYCPNIRFLEIMSDEPMHIGDNIGKVPKV